MGPLSLGIPSTPPHYATDDDAYREKRCYLVILLFTERLSCYLQYSGTFPHNVRHLFSPVSHSLGLFVHRGYCGNQLFPGVTTGFPLATQIYPSSVPPQPSASLANPEVLGMFLPNRRWAQWINTAHLQVSYRFLRQIPLDLPESPHSNNGLLGFPSTFLQYPDTSPPESIPEINYLNAISRVMLLTESRLKRQVQNIVKNTNLCWLILICFHCLRVCAGTLS